MKKFRNYILSGLATLSLLITPVVLVSVMSQGRVSAQAAGTTQSELCKGANLSFSGTGNDCAGTGEGSANSKLDKLVKDIVNIFSVVVGIVAVVMIIIGGFKYVTSGGDSNKVTSAKNTILYAIIGLVIVAFAQFIVKFVIGKTSGVATTSGG